MTKIITEELTIVSYDVSDDRRRYRLVKVLEGYGVRVQKSIFECWLLPSQLLELKSRIAPFIHPSEDCIAYYSLTQSNLSEIILLGTAYAISENPQAYVA